jgi:hypothetical protein
MLGDGEMRKMVLGIILVISLAMFSLIQRVQPSAVLINPNFETGNFYGWYVSGTCTISNTIVHSGSYSAYISDIGYDNSLSQIIYPRVGLPVTSSLYLVGWIYPLKVGWMQGEYPKSFIWLEFYNVSTMQLAYELVYSWSMSVENYNSSLFAHIFLPMTVSEWNLVSRNVTADFYSAFEQTPSSDIVLYSISIKYHYSNGSPGPFYADDLEVLTESELGSIYTVNLYPTCPYPYVPSNQTRINEPTLVKVNASDSVEKATLYFRRTGKQWFAVDMVFNDTESLWAQTIPGQSENCTIELFVTVWDIYGLSATSSTYSLTVRPLPVGDLNGDDHVDMKDIRIVAKQFGQHIP